MTAFVCGVLSVSNAKERICNGDDGKTFNGQLGKSRFLNNHLQALCTAQGA